MKKEKVSILVDGANFYHLVLKKLGIEEGDFLFDDFVKFLVGGREISNYGKRFYVGTVREQPDNPRSKEAMSKQTKLFTTLKSQGWEIKTSKLRTRTEEIIIDSRVVDYKRILKKGIKKIEFKRTREKGIDVKLATDLIAGAVDKQHNTAIIVSSDSDLIPALDWLRHRTKVKTEYVGFSIKGKGGDGSNDTKPLQSMISHTDIQRVLIDSDLRPFIQPQQQKLS